MKIILGQHDNKPVGFDLDTLISTRLLIQANSGAGKSYLLRKLIEQLFGHIQVIVIDPEGEFSTLREKFGFVLVGKGGEAPADPRIAADVAEKLLEIRASAVCDLYEVKPADRHLWVKRFLEALINAPKKLWHPTIVVVDEAHIFCPEKGAGESEAKEAMLDLSSRGRKRGFCPVWATQRLSKLDKDGSSNLLNRLVGGTFEDVDIKRALDLLSIAPEDKRQVAQQLKTIDPGWFFAFGRAIAKERVLFKVGQVETSHPKPGSAKHASEPPPAPEQVRDLLPKLADLPKAAEEKARTMQDLQAKVRSLTAELAAAKKQQPEAANTQASAAEVRRAIALATNEALALRDQEWMRTIENFGRSVEKVIEDSSLKFKGALHGVKLDLPRKAKALNLPAPAPALPPTAVTPWKAPTYVEGPPVPRESYTTKSDTPEVGNGNLSGPEQRILNQLAELEALGIAEPKKSQLGLMCGYTNFRSGGFSEPLASLLKQGFVVYRPQARVSITENGRAVANPSDTPLDTEELQRRLLAKLDNAAAKILRPIIDAYPEMLDKDELGRSLGYTNPRSGGFSEPLSQLRALGLVDYPDRGKVVAMPVLFLEDAA